LAAVLTRYSDRFLTLLGEAGVIDDPGHHRFLLTHCGYGIPSGLPQHGFITPRGIGYQVMQRLMHPPRILGRQPRAIGSTLLRSPGSNSPWQ
jgi:hypothetical protein